MNRRIRETRVPVMTLGFQQYFERDGMKRYARHDRPLVSVHRDVAINDGTRHDRCSNSRSVRGRRE
jgi:hypothetical protein